jgi:hypothetical protein
MQRFLHSAAAHPAAVHRLCNPSATRAKARFSLANVQVQLLVFQAPALSNMANVYEVAADLLRISVKEAQHKLSTIVTPSLRDRFDGAMHCEAVLASLVHLSAADPERSVPLTHPLLHFESAEPIIGISEICCPCCAHLFDILGQGEYIHGDVHTRFRACSLPEELPLGILQDMVRFATQVLRPRLFAFCNHSKADSEGKVSESSSSSPERPGIGAQQFEAFIQDDLQLLAPLSLL